MEAKRRSMVMRKDRIGWGKVRGGDVMKIREEREEEVVVIFVGVATMVAWRDSGIVVVTYTTTRMHTRMLRSVGCRDVSGRRVSSRDYQCTTTYYSDRKVCF